MLCYVKFCSVFACLFLHVWSFQPEYHATINCRPVLSGSRIKMTLIAHSIKCDLSIAWHEFQKTGTICGTLSAKKYRFASTSRKIVVKFLKETKVIFFKEGCGTKIEHVSGLKSTDNWLMHNALRSTPRQSRLVFNGTIHSDPDIYNITVAITSLIHVT